MGKKKLSDRGKHKYCRRRVTAWCIDTHLIYHTNLWANTNNCTAINGAVWRRPACVIASQTHLSRAGGLSKYNHWRSIRPSAQPIHFTGTAGHTQRLERSVCASTADEDIMTDDELFSFSHMCKSKTIMTAVLTHCHETWCADCWFCVIIVNIWPFSKYI